MLDNQKVQEKLHLPVFLFQITLPNRPSKPVEKTGNLHCDSSMVWHSHNTHNFGQLRHPRHGTKQISKGWKNVRASQDELWSRVKLYRVSTTYFFLIKSIWKTIKIRFRNLLICVLCNRYGFLGVYTLEMMLKIFAKGFVLNKFSYLRNKWNMLDFVVWISCVSSYRVMWIYQSN